MLMTNNVHLPVVTIAYNRSGPDDTDIYSQIHFLGRNYIHSILAIIWSIPIKQIVGRDSNIDIQSADVDISVSAKHID